MALLIPFLSVQHMIGSAVAETGTSPSFIMVTGVGIAQLAYVVLAFGLCVGRFRIFELRQRWSTIVAAFAMFVLGTILVNFQAIFQ
ncbi:MAG: hypothetical protein ABL957_10340 [Parvularculaceae bacterium]